MNICNLNNENFSPYGIIIQCKEGYEKERFHVLLSEEREPWRIAIFNVTQKEISRLECHNSSYETFEPMEGVGVLVVAEHDSPDMMQAFLLDRPVCLKKGTWHDVITISEKTQYKITENKEVTSEFYNLKKSISIEMI